MAILNETFDFRSVSAEVRRAFRGQTATRQLFLAGHEFYKFTQHPLSKPDGSLTPWWSSVTPLSPQDPGWVGSHRLAQNLGVSDVEFARVRAAVTKQWNSMSNLLKIRLIVPVYGFVGVCSGQLVDQSQGMENVFYIGGAWQAWIPNLTRSHVIPV